MGKIAFLVGGGGYFEVATINADGTGQTILNPGQNSRRPAWSPDDSEIAYNAGTLWIMNADGTNRRDTGVAGTDPYWSPDGTRIVYSTPFQIYILDLATNSSTYVVDGQNPTWSPDGQSIAYSRSGSIYTYNLTAGTETALASGGSNATPSWSPDGGQIAYTKCDHSGPLPVCEITVIDSHTGAFIKTLTTGTVDIHPTWSPDGQYIAFERTDQVTGDSGIYFVSYLSGAVTLVTDNPDAREITPMWQRTPVPGGPGGGDHVATTKEQCKKDGWRSLTRADGSQFKNQGDCMQYVNTGK